MIRRGAGPAYGVLWADAGYSPDFALRRLGRTVTQGGYGRLQGYMARKRSEAAKRRGGKRKALARRRFWIGQLGASIILWLIFTQTPSGAELVIGIAAAVFATAAADGIRDRNFGVFRPYWRWWLQTRGLPGAVIHDCGVLASVLFATIFRGERKSGSFMLAKVQARRAGGRSAARRALVLTMASLPPNSVVIGIDSRKGLMLIHQVRPAQVPQYLKSLGVE